MKTLDQLRPVLQLLAEQNPGRRNPVITRVTADSRAVISGSLFVAVQGDRADGHRFIADAVARGAVAVVGTAAFQEHPINALTDSNPVPYLQVADSRLALARCCAAWHDFPSRSMTVIGVTGTDGKTSTATLLESILTVASTDEHSPAGRVGTITTVAARIQGETRQTGLHVTTPDAPDVQQYLADMRDAGCSYAIIESTSHGIAQGRVAAVDFDVAAVTNITHEHLDYHGTWESYAAAKAGLFRSLFRSEAKPGVPRFSVLNADDAASFGLLGAVLAEEAARAGQDLPTISYGIADEQDSAVVTASLIATAVAYLPDRTIFEVHGLGRSVEIETSLVGMFNVQNILCAVSIALGLGVSVDAVREGVRSLQGIVGRMERIDRGQPFLALVDFAHSPASLERALKTLRTVASVDGRIIAVFGCAGLRDKAKRGLMGQVSGQYADFTVITAEDPRTEDLAQINRAIEEGLLAFADVDAYAIVPDRTEAIQRAVNRAQPGDVVVAFGKGHEQSICFGEIEYPWSDQEAMIAALERRIREGSTG